MMVCELVTNLPANTDKIKKNLRAFSAAIRDNSEATKRAAKAMKDFMRHVVLRGLKKTTRCHEITIGFRKGIKKRQRKKQIKKMRDAWHRALESCGDNSRVVR